MRLERLRLQNFRRFENLDITFDDSVTVIVGGNGFGKTAVLDAAAIAIGCYLLGIGGTESDRRHITLSDARVVTRRVGNITESRPQFPVRVSAEGTVLGQHIAWSRELGSASGRTTTANASSIRQISDSVWEYLQTGGPGTTLPIISYYGTGRLWGQTHHRGERSVGTLRETAYKSALSPKADNEMLEQWLKRATLIELQGKRPIPELGAVRHAIEKCVSLATGSSYAKVYYDVETDRLMVESQNDGETSALSLEQLSDGYRTTLGMVGDMAYRMAVLNPHLEERAVTDTPGVVLIDEVDLHLHPRWQARILGDLRTVFPMVQFIVTTHSPSVIASVSKEHLRIIDSSGSVYVPGEQTYGHDVSSIYEDVLGAPSRPKEVSELFDRAFRALDAAEDGNGSYDQVEALLDQIAKTVGEDDSELAELRTSLWLAKME